jgi:hypothetical protein
VLRQLSKDATFSEEWRLLGCYRHVALVITDVSEEISAYFIRVSRIGVGGTTRALTCKLRKLEEITIPKLGISKQRTSVASNS